MGSKRREKALLWHGLLTVPLSAQLVVSWGGRFVGRVGRRAPNCVSPFEDRI